MMHSQLSSHSSLILHKQYPPHSRLHWSREWPAAVSDVPYSYNACVVRNAHADLVAQFAFATLAFPTAHATFNASVVIPAFFSPVVLDATAVFFAFASPAALHKLFIPSVPGYFTPTAFDVPMALEVLCSQSAVFLECTG